MVLTLKWLNSLSKIPSGKIRKLERVGKQIVGALTSDT